MGGLVLVVISGGRGFFGILCELMGRWITFYFRVIRTNRPVPSVAKVCGKSHYVV